MKCLFGEDSVTSFQVALVRIPPQSTRAVASQVVSKPALIDGFGDVPDWQCWW